MQSIRSAHGTMRVKVGQAEAGHRADMAMQVASSGTADLHALMMLVLHATRPFSTPATLPQGHASQRHAVSFHVLGNVASGESGGKQAPNWTQETGGQS